jgi:hypothetical protein
MAFDIDPWGKYLATGTQTGKVLIYDTSTFELKTSSSEQGRATYDAVNSVQYHPFSALLFSAAGQRHFPDFDVDESSSGSDEEDVGSDKISSLNKKVKVEPVNYSSLQIWGASYSPILQNFK